MINSSLETNMFVLPDLRQIQFKSVRYFFQSVLPVELQSNGSFHIVGKKRFEFTLFGKSYRIERPRLSHREAIEKLSMYAINLYIPARFVDITTSNMQRETLWLGSIPLIDSSGTFVINGISRCVVNQILRTPGIYYTLNAEGTYIATIICNSGRRLRLELDTVGNLSVRITRKCKISIVLLLFCMGLDIIDIPSTLTIRTSKIEDLLVDIDHAEKRVQKILSRLIMKDQNIKITEDIPVLCLWKDIFTVPYDLGHTGRLHVNQTLHVYGISPKETQLLPRDIISSAERLLKTASSTLYIDDIDELSNKYIKSVGEVMHEQLTLSLKDLKERVHNKINEISSYKKLPSLRRLIGATPLTVSFNQFFGSYALSQFLDQTNSLADMVHKRRLSAMGPGGLTVRTATFRARDIHSSQYGKICPVETAEGQNAGIVTSFSISAAIDNKGIIKTPVCFSNKFSFPSKMVRLLSAREDLEYKVATGNLLTVVHNVNDISTTPVQCQREFLSTRWNQVDFRNILPVYLFSVGVSIIPFLEHDDATRALMGSNMQRQAVPLVASEKPIVGTGLESQIALDSGDIIISAQDGKVKDVDARHIVINNCAISDQHKASEEYLIMNYKRSNNSTCINQRPTVKVGQSVKRGQIIADGAVTIGGELSLGKNVLVAYMPWEGYNFEDAVLISERLVHEDIYTSLHIEKYDTEIRETIEGLERLTKEIPHLNKYLLRHLDKEGVVSLGAWVEPGDVLVGKLTPQEASNSRPENKLLQAIFGSETIKTKDTSLKVPPRSGGRVIDIKWIFRNTSALSYHKIISISILQKRKIKVGDKVAGRHGNKGIVSRILPIQSMPYLQDGTPVDMVLSPLGIPSRMNVGQVLECLLGLAGKYLNKHYRIMPFDERYEKEASRKLVFSELYDSSQKKGFPWLFEYNNPGKSVLFDGRTGDRFEQAITVGQAYILKLIHQADNKIHARSTGPYAMVTQQPLRGKSRQGGQRVGEMEVWALQGFGASHVLQEMLFVKSDHIEGRLEAFSAMVAGKPIPNPVGAQASLSLLIRELRCLGMNVKNEVISKRNLMTRVIDI